jgi:hypothetical protein
MRAARITALGSYPEFELRTDPKAKYDRFVRLAAIVQHVESSDPTSSVFSGFVAEAIRTISELLLCGIERARWCCMDSVVLIVSTEDCTQPRSLSSQLLMSAGLQLRLELSEFGSEPFTHGMPDQREIPRPRPAADVR